MVRQSKRRRGNSGDAVAEDGAEVAEVGAAGRSPSENVGGDANAGEGGAEQRKSRGGGGSSLASNGGAVSDAAGAEAEDGESAEAFFASLEFDSVESVVSMRKKVLAYLEERARERWHGRTHHLFVGFEGGWLRALRAPGNPR